jgi:hypothetical protein
MNHPANAALFASLKQRSHAGRMDTFRVLSSAVLQDTGAINNRVNANQQRKPLFSPASRGNIQRDPTGESQLRMEMAREPDYLMSFPGESRRNPRSNQAGCSRHQDLHRIVPSVCCFL